MHSVIITALAAFFCSFWRIFKESTIYRAFDKVYSAFSNAWKNSVVIGKVKKIKNTGLEKGSVLYKIIHLPFWILEKTGKKAGEKISASYEKSFILKSTFAFLDNALALNTRFLGLIILSGVLSRQVFSFSFSYKLLAVTAICIILLLLDFNITDFFAESKAVELVLATVGFKNISWDFYDKNNIKKPNALVLAIIIGILCGILSLKSLIWAVIPFFGLVGASIVLKYPILGIFFSAFLAPFVPTMVLAALIVYTSVSFCFYAIRQKDFEWKIGGVGTGLGFFLMFMFASSVFSFNAKKSILIWGLYLIFVGYFFIITNAVKTREQLYSIIKVFVIAGLFVSIYGIAQYVFGWNTQNAWIDEEMFEDATMRAYSTMENPNVLGEYLLLVIPLSIFLVINSSFKTLEKWFYMGTVAASTLCMVLTQSRGCWIGLFVAAVIFITFYNGRLWGLLPFAILALPFVLPQTMIERFMSVGNLEDSSTSYRVFIWLGTISMLRDFWLGGIGMGEGAFRSVYPFYSYNSIIAPHSHNLYLQFLTEGGICALLIFLVTIVVYVKKMSAAFSDNGKRSKDGTFALLSICAVSGFLVQSMFDYTFYNYRMMSMFFMLIALSCCLWNFKGVSAIENN
jgi:O-antigen ligase